MGRVGRGEPGGRPANGRGRPGGGEGGGAGPAAQAISVFAAEPDRAGSAVDARGFGEGGNEGPLPLRRPAVAAGARRDGVEGESGAGLSKSYITRFRRRHQN